MTQAQNHHRDANSIIQFIIGSFIAILFLSSSFHEFSFNEKYIKSLKNGLWQKQEFKISPHFKIDILHFRMNTTKIRVKYGHQEFYEDSCNGALQNICKYIENKEIQVTSLNFYINSKDQNSENQIILLDSITFIDKEGAQQVFPNMPYAPNSPQYITEEKKVFRNIFIFAFLKHFFFALFFIAHISTIYAFKASTEKWIRYFILTAFSVSFLSLVIRYFLI